MVHENSNGGQQEKPKGKPRGKPFPKGHIPANKILGSSGHEASNRGEPLKTANEQSGIDFHLPKTAFENINKLIKDSMEATEPPSENKILETIEFRNGENTLKINLVSKPNRVFKIEVVLNDEIPIRQANYAGSSAGYNFWKLLKGSLKK